MSRLLTLILLYKSEYIIDKAISFKKLEEATKYAAMKHCRKVQVIGMRKEMTIYHV